MNPETEQKYFKKALADFVHDFASGGAIRHLAAQGYTVPEIMKQLDFPAPKSRVAETVWNYYLDTGKILLEKPPESGIMQTACYVKEQGKYGRVTMRRVLKEQKLERSFIPCDFGRQIYQNPHKFRGQIAGLSKRDQEYLLELPWPLAMVYHEADERMERIMKIIGDGLY